MFWVMTHDARPSPHEPGDRRVARVGLRGAQGLVGLELAPPGLAARLLRRHELAEVDGPEPVPDAARAPEVGDPGLGADPRPGEEDDPAGGFDESRESA